MRPRLSIHREDLLLHESSADEVRLGQAPDCEIRLDDPGVAARQGLFRWTPDGYVYVDCGRTMTLLVRGRASRVIQRSPDRQALVADGDLLVIGASSDLVNLRVGISAAVPEPPARTIKSGAPLAEVDRFERHFEHDLDALGCLYRVVRDLASGRTREEMFGTLCELILRHFEQATRVTVYQGDDSDDFRTAVSLDRASSEVVGEPMSRSLMRHISEKQEAVLFAVGDSTVDFSASLLSRSIHTGICVPLRDRSRIVGALQVDCRDGRKGEFGERDLELMTLIGNQASILLANLSMVASVERMNAQLVEALQRVEMLRKAKEYLGKFVPWAVRRRVELPAEDLDASTAPTAATILFLDIGGYTRLTEALSQEEVARLVETYFSAYIDAIQENGGDVNETAGDGLMIIFRAFDASDHAHAAVRTAIAVRRETRRINEELEGFDAIDVNVGIETGRVIVGSRKIQGLAGTRWTYTATGMVTNLAARIAAHATEGRVFLGPAAAAAVEGAFALAEGREVEFKNVSQPVRVFELLDG